MSPLVNGGGNVWIVACMNSRAVETHIRKCIIQSRTIHILKYASRLGQRAQNVTHNSQSPLPYISLLAFLVDFNDATSFRQQPQLITQSLPWIYHDVNFKMSQWLPLCRRLMTPSPAANFPWHFHKGHELPTETGMASGGISIASKSFVMRATSFIDTYSDCCSKRTLIRYPWRQLISCLLENTQQKKGRSIMALYRIAKPGHKYVLPFRSRCREGSIISCYKGPCNHAWLPECSRLVIVQ